MTRRTREGKSRGWQRKGKRRGRKKRSLWSSEPWLEQRFYLLVVSTTETASLSSSSVNTAVSRTSYWVEGWRLLST